MHLQTLRVANCYFMVVIYSVFGMVSFFWEVYVLINPKCAGKKKAYTALLQCRTFLCRKKWGPQRKDFGGRCGFPGLHRVFVSITDPEGFSLRPGKYPKDFLSMVVVYVFSSLVRGGDRNNRKGGTASLRSRTCIKRNAVFGARFKSLSLYFLYQTGNLIRIKTGLDTCIPDTYPNQYPPVTVPPL